MRKINHFGVPTLEKQANENYVEGMKVHLTAYSDSPNKIEFLRFEEGSWLPEIIQKVPHIAYEVPTMETALQGAKIIVEPLRAGDNLTIAFIEEEGIPIELMCFDK
jgi:hypothetical protein